MNDGYTCPNCGVFVYTYQYHSCFPNQQVGWVEPLPCNHCYCLLAYGHGGTNPHKQCCKCGDIMAQEFIKIDNMPYGSVDGFPPCTSSSGTSLVLNSDGTLTWEILESYKYKKLKYVSAMEYFPNCRTCDCGYYTGIKFFESLKELLNYAKDNWNDYELKDIHNNNGKFIGRITYKTGYHSLEYLEFKFKYLTMRTCDDGHGKLMWKRL